MSKIEAIWVELGPNQNSGYGPVWPSDRIPLVGRRAQNFTSHFGLQCVQKFSFFRYVSTAFSLPTVRYRYSNIPSSP